MGKQTWPGLMALASHFLVELPRIETGAEIALNCKNTILDDAKVRETTRDDLRNAQRRRWHQHVQPTCHRARRR